MGIENIVTRRKELFGYHVWRNLHKFWWYANISTGKQQEQGGEMVQFSVFHSKWFAMNWAEPLVKLQHSGDMNLLAGLPSFGVQRFCRGTFPFGLSMCSALSDQSRPLHIGQIISKNEENEEKAFLKCSKFVKCCKPVLYAACFS